MPCPQVAGLGSAWPVPHPRSVPAICRDDIQLVECIGRGTYGTVCFCSPLACHAPPVSISHHSHIRTARAAVGTQCYKVSHVVKRGIFSHMHYETAMSGRDC